jgi:hypothetical protein
MLNGGLAELFRLVTEEAQRRGIAVHWATAWQMYQAADALIQGRQPVPSQGIAAVGAAR